MDARLRHYLPQSPADPVDGPAWLEIIPSLADLAHTPQDPIYHAEGDVWTHTLMVLDALKASAAYAASDADTRLVLFLAALLHDIAKPSCTQVEAGGRISSAGHSRRGAVDARIVLWRLGVPFALRERICRIVATHQVPFFVLGNDRRGRRPEFVLHQLAEEGRVCDLHAVAHADMVGRTYHGKVSVLDDLALVRVMAEEEGCWSSPRPFADAHTRWRYFQTQGAVSPDHPFHQEPGSRVIVMAGLPASGKNTWVATHHPDLPVVSFDDAKQALGWKPGDSPGAAVHWATDRARELLRARAPFVWNATHLSPSMRQKTLGLLADYHAETHVVYLEAPEPVLHSRNSARNTTLRGRDLTDMLHRWDVPLPWEAHSVRYLVQDKV